MTIEQRRIRLVLVTPVGKVLGQLPVFETPVPHWSEVESVVDKIAQAGFESVAVGLIHSYLNPAHEELVRDVLAEKLPRVAVSISSEVSPQMREYERFNTV